MLQMDTSKLPVDGVLLDVDDTMIDTAGAFGDAIGAVRRTYLPHVPAAKEPEMLAFWRNDIGGHYRAYTRGELTMDGQRMIRAAELHAHYGGPVVDEASYPRWMEVFWGTFQNSWRAYADVFPAIAALRAAGLRIGIVTNATVALQRQKFAATGLSEFDDLIIGVDTIGVGKPEPEIFLAGCDLIGTTPERTAYVGDEPDIDARAAADAGLFGIWLDRPGVQRYGPSAGSAADATGHRIRRITSLAQLPEVLGLPDAIKG